MEEAQTRNLGMGMGQGVKMVSNQEIQQAQANQTQLFSETVALATLGLANVKEATSGALITVREVREPHLFPPISLPMPSHVKFCLTWKGCWGSWMNVREEVQAEVMVQGKVSGDVQFGWEGTSEPRSCGWSHRYEKAQEPTGKDTLRFDPDLRGLSVWCLHVFPMTMPLPGAPPPKHIRVCRLIRFCKIVPNVEGTCVNV